VEAERLALCADVIYLKQHKINPARPAANRSSGAKAFDATVKPISPKFFGG
jgi:hypothetical protein